MLHKLTGETDTDYTSMHRRTAMQNITCTGHAAGFVCFKFQHFVFCKREPGSLLLQLIIIPQDLF